jgi:hypothetical protein
MGYTFSFEVSEFTIGERIFKSVDKVSAEQPTKEEVAKGTQSAPQGRTVGSMDLGTGAFNMTDMSERGALIDMLAKQGPYREVIWNCSYVMTRTRSDGVVDVEYIQCYGCRLLNEADDASSGTPISSAMDFSFEKKSINGHFPHSGM